MKDHAVPVLAGFICLADGSPAAAPVEIGQWLTVVAFLLGIVYLFVNIYFKFFPHKQSGEQYVTKEQLEATIATFTANVASVVADFRTMKVDFHSDLKAAKVEMEALKTSVLSTQNTLNFLAEKMTDIKSSYKELQTYTSTNTHEIKNTLNAMGLKMERTVIAVELLTKMLPKAAADA